jgi:hypothetical protein
MEPPVNGDATMCNDSRCENGYIILGEYVAADGSVDTHTHPCGECNDASNQATGTIYRFAPELIDEIPF